MDEEGWQMVTRNYPHAMKTVIIILIGLVAGQLSAQPKAVYTSGDRQIFREYLTAIEPYRDASAEIILEKSAFFLLDKPYVAHTLERANDERLTVNLRAFDCTTFVETVIALVLTATGDAPLFETFMEELTALRYRAGTIDGYSSRLHYATDWLHENEQRRLMRNISTDLGGAKEERLLNFMSTHREAYSRLRKDDGMLGRITLMEEMINRRGGFYYLPKEQIEELEDQIPHMSVVLFTTDIGGLDVTHMGFAYRKEGRLTLLHASSAGERVMVEELSISDYTYNQRNSTGIIVAEINLSYSK